MAQDGPKVDPSSPKFFHLCGVLRAFSLDRGPSESDFDISMKCAISMFDDIFFFKTSVFTRQGPNDSDLGISIRYALSLFDEHVR